MPTHGEMPILYYDGKPIGKIANIEICTEQSVGETYATMPQEFTFSFNATPISRKQLIKILGIRGYIRYKLICIRHRTALHRPQKTIKG